MLELEGKVLDAIKTVYDPEIPVNVYDLGLIYEIKIDASNIVFVKMTLTSPNCPIAESMPGMIREAVKIVEGVEEVIIDLVFDPLWSREMMSEAALLELGML